MISRRAIFITGAVQVLRDRRSAQNAVAGRLDVHRSSAHEPCGFSAGSSACAMVSRS
jgi:hypothetical protein